MCSVTGEPERDGGHDAAALGDGVGGPLPCRAACAIVSQIRRLVAEGLREGKARYVLSYAPVVGLTSALDDDLVRCRE